jgi:hypothetical protein
MKLSVIDLPRMNPIWSVSMILSICRCNLVVSILLSILTPQLCKEIGWKFDICLICCLTYHILSNFLCLNLVLQFETSIRTINIKKIVTQLTMNQIDSMSFRACTTPFNQASPHLSPGGFLKKISAAGAWWRDVFGSRP